MISCSKIAKNGLPCEKELRHRGPHSNTFCAKCGINKKDKTNPNKSASCFCRNCYLSFLQKRFQDRYYNDQDFHSRHKNWGQRFPEHATVIRHWYCIFKLALTGSRRQLCYLNMPFYDEWNPTKGGSFQAGANWIIKNIGRRPGKGWSLDIIQHEKGFVPGNLRWALINTQIRNRLHRILGQFSEEEFAVEAFRRGYVKTTL